MAAWWRARDPRQSARRVRLATGMVLLAYVLSHLVSHALGLWSLEAMESARGRRQAMQVHLIEDMRRLPGGEPTSSAPRRQTPDGFDEAGGATGDLRCGE